MTYEQYKESYDAIMKQQQRINNLVYNQALEDCCNVLKRCWLNGTVANRIVKEQIAEIEKLKR